MEDGQMLGRVPEPVKTGERVQANRGYDSQVNRELLQGNQLRDGIARRAKPDQERRQRLDARNRTINSTRARVEHVFAGVEQLGGNTVRAMTLARNELAITLKCVTYSVKRRVWLVGTTRPLAFKGHMRLECLGNGDLRRRARPATLRKGSSRLRKGRP